MSQGTTSQQPAAPAKPLESALAEQLGGQLKPVLDLVLAETSRQRQEMLARSEVKVTADGLEATDLNGIYQIANIFFNAGLIFDRKGQKTPKQLVAEAVVKIAYGAELGMKPLASLQSIMVTTAGIPSIYGDAMKAVVLKSGLAEYVRENSVGAPNTDTFGWRCVTKRKGQAEEETTFTVADAKHARLWGKDGPWTFYPGRMLMFRARSFRLRDTYPDILKGLLSVEEAMDIPSAETAASAQKTSLASLGERFAESSDESAPVPPEDEPAASAGADEPQSQAPAVTPEAAPTPAPSPVSQDQLLAIFLDQLKQVRTEQAVLQLGAPAGLSEADLKPLRDARIADIRAAAKTKKANGGGGKGAPQSHMFPQGTHPS